MHANIVTILKNTLMKSQAGKGQLFRVTQGAQNYVKPFTVKNNIKSLMFSTMKQDNNYFNIQSSENHKSTTFDNTYRTTRPIDLRAYSISAADSGIAGFVEDIEMDSIPYYQVSWNNLAEQKNIQNNNIKTDLEKNELSSIYVLLKLYANTFRGKRVEIYCDNVSVIRMLQENKTKTDLKPIINKITSICNENKINPLWQRIVGIPQIAADRLVHNVDNPFQYSSFKPQTKPDEMGLTHLNDIFNVC